MTSRHLACRDIVELVTAYLEDALPELDAERFELHLAMCDACVEYVAQMRRVPGLVSGAAEEPAEPPAIDALLEAFRNRRTT